MRMVDVKEICASREVVFGALLDADVLKACVPGCTEMTGSAAEGFEAVVVQKVGPVKATFKGAVTVSEVDAPNGVRLDGEGKGGAAGFAKGGAVVRLEAVSEDVTALHYEVEAKVGGKLAQLGSRIIDGFAKKMADQFFENFRAAVEGPPAEGDAAPEAGAGTGSETGAKKGWLRKLTG